MLPPFPPANSIWEKFNHFCICPGFLNRGRSSAEMLRRCTGGLQCPGSSISCLACETGEGMTCERSAGEKASSARRVITSKESGESYSNLGINHSLERPSHHANTKICSCTGIKLAGCGLVCSCSWTRQKEWTGFLNGACHRASPSAWLSSFTNYTTNTIWMEEKTLRIYQFRLPNNPLTFAAAKIKQTRSPKDNVCVYI